MRKGDPVAIARMISQLNPRELRTLAQLLKDTGMDGLVGVREPRRPSPESPGDAAVAVADEAWPAPDDMTRWPADYWESQT